MQRQYIVKLIGNVSDWLSCAGGALIKVADSAGSTVINKGIHTIKVKWCMGLTTCVHFAESISLDGTILFLTLSRLNHPILTPSRWGQSLF